MIISKLVIISSSAVAGVAAMLALASVFAAIAPVQPASAEYHDENGNSDTSTTTSGSSGNSVDNSGLLTDRVGGNDNDTTAAAVNATNRVAVGGGNITVQYYTFSPQVVNITAGQSVTWYSPTEFSELHTVTFVLNQSLVSDIILPFGIHDPDELELLPPFNVGEALIITEANGTQAVLALNKLTWYPSVSDSGGSVITYLNGTDIQYTMNGTEGVINSGIIQQWPPEETETSAENGTAGTNATEAAPAAADVGTNVTAQQQEGNQTTGVIIETEAQEEGPPFPFVNTFTVTFSEPGTYDYFCALHPWMVGQVVVTEEGTETTATAETGNQTSSIT